MSQRIFYAVRPLGRKYNLLRMMSTTAKRNANNEAYKQSDDEIRLAMAIDEKKKISDALQSEDPFKRVSKILKRDMKVVGHKLKRFMGFHPSTEPDTTDQFFPTHTDVLIIGGGAIGSSIAYWLKQRAPRGMHVTVVDKGTTHAEAATCLSAGGLHKQFSLPENVQMSLFGAEFLRNIRKNLAVDGFPPPEVQFHPYGCLILASEAGAATLKENSDLQRRLGSRNILLTPEKLQDKFPWVDVNGIELGCLGVDLEGWFNPWSLVNAFKQKSINLGADYVEGAIVGFEFKEQALIIAPSKDGKYEQLERAIIKMPDGEFKTIKFGFCVVAAGSQSGIVGKMARLGEGEGLLGIPLPIEPRKRQVCLFDCPGGPGLDTPLVIDPTGAYFRREGLGSTYIGGTGMSSALQDEQLSADQYFFEEKVRPLLASRVPAFEKLDVKSIWTNCYEYNTLDENGIIGPHPFYHNLFIASGFSSYGIQHAPAVGRAVMELMLDGEYKTIDLSRLAFDRLCLGEPLREKNIS